MIKHGVLEQFIWFYNKLKAHEDVAIHVLLVDYNLLHSLMPGIGMQHAAQSDSEEAMLMLKLRNRHRTHYVSWSSHLYSLGPITESHAQDTAYCCELDEDGY